MTIVAENVIEVIEVMAPKLLRFGLPLQRGKLRDLNNLYLSVGNISLPTHAEASGHWSDGSIRWLFLTTIVQQPGCLNLCQSSADLSLQRSTSTGLGNIEFAKELEFSSETHDYSLFSIAVDVNICASIKVAGFSKPIMLDVKQKSIIKNDITQTLDLFGQFRLDKRHLNIHCNVSECIETREINIELRLHNPHRAMHDGGLWDLGDPGSVIVDEFSLCLRSPFKKTELILKDVGIDEQERDQIFKPLRGEFLLQQQGSGGVNWNSPVHWNKDKTLDIKFRGFTLRDAGGHEAQGLRAVPIVKLELDKSSLLVVPQDFWQNFPAQIKASADTVQFGLFPDRCELQGGESKTWKINCLIQSNVNDVDNPVNDFASLQPMQFRYNKDYVNSTQVFPHFNLGCSNYIASLIEAGLNGSKNFFEKREAIDEYGWRNFGDLYADHEAVADPKAEFFISHYNNQYDPLMGMTKQFLASGDFRWLDLIEPLNRHIQDIDIYNTDEDKSDYNRGLFWHTDHYLPAETSSHRSHSKYHSASYEGFLGGGGPGGQHCYTTGLAMQSCLSGDKNAGNSVVQLCNWERNFYRGDGSLLDRSFRFLKYDLKKNVLTNLGFKAPGFRLPLDRGTGNFLVALLDCYDLTGNRAILIEAGQVIQDTIHPNEDISLRNLDDCENTWFYTVFLQAVARFLLIKEVEEEADGAYWFARHGFMHYADWMIRHEEFYLNHPERLEFPNDTWCAQDIRKATLFCYAHYFSADDEGGYLSRAREFYQYVSDHLTASKEAQFTRILALLMQNDGVEQRFLNDSRSKFSFKECDFGKAPRFSVAKILFVYLSDMLKLLPKISIKREWHWLKTKF